MKKIIIVTNHLQNGDGVCRILINFANALAEVEDYDITISFMLRFDKSVLPSLSKKIKVQRAFHIPCFRGYDRLQSYLPGKFLYKRAVKKEKYDLEIAFCWRNPTIAIANSLNKEAKHLLYTHSFTKESDKYYEKFDEVIAIASSTLEQTKKDIHDGTPVIRFSNIFNEQKILDQSKAPAEITKPEGRFLFVTVGRIDSLKGFNRILSSTKKLVSEGYDFEYWFIGKGDEEDEFKKYVKQNNLDNYIKFLGLKPNPYNYMRQADVYFCTSVSEGYSTTCVESCILEVPCLSTDVGGAIDIINDSEAGMIVENSEEGVYQGMKYVLDNKEKVAEWKQKLTKTKEKFFYQNRKEQLIKIIEDLMNK